MSFDEIFDLTAGVYFNFYNIYEFRRNLRSHSWSVFSFFIIYIYASAKSSAKAFVRVVLLQLPRKLPRKLSRKLPPKKLPWKLPRKNPPKRLPRKLPWQLLESFRESFHESFNGSHDGSFHELPPKMQTMQVVQRDTEFSRRQAVLLTATRSICQDHYGSGVPSIFTLGSKPKKGIVLEVHPFLAYTLFWL